MLVLQFFLLDGFCAFLLEYSLTSHVTFSRFRSSFLSDLYCSHSEVKLKYKRLQHSEKQKVIAEWVVLQVRDRGLCFESGHS